MYKWRVLFSRIKNILFSIDYISSKTIFFYVCEWSLVRQCFSSGPGYPLAVLYLVLACAICPGLVLILIVPIFLDRCRQSKDTLWSDRDQIILPTSGCSQIHIVSGYLTSVDIWTVNLFKSLLKHLLKSLTFSTIVLWHQYVCLNKIFWKNSSQIICIQGGTRKSGHNADSG